MTYKMHFYSKASLPYKNKYATETGEIEYIKKMPQISLY